MEHWGNNQNYISSAMHTPSSFGATENYGGRIIPNVSDVFHTYTLDWFPDRMVFSVDGIVHYMYKPNSQNEATWPFNAPQYLILNIAIESSVLSSFTQSSMDVEYVRIYQEGHLDAETNVLPNQVMVYPNPAQSELFIQNSTDQFYTYEIYNALGKLVQSSKSATDSMAPINIKDPSHGLYFVHVTMGNSAQTLRFIKN